MAEASGATETPVQLINIGLIVLTHDSIFARDVRKWQALLDADKTWTNSKMQFRTAQKAMKQSQPITTTDTLGYHQEVNAASIIDEFMSRITSSSSIDDGASFSLPASTTQAAKQIAEHHLQQQLASIAASSIQNQTMMEQMKTLMSTITDLQTQLNQGTSRGGGDRHRPPYVDS